MNAEYEDTQWRKRAWKIWCSVFGHKDDYALVCVRCGDVAGAPKRGDVE